MTTGRWGLSFRVFSVPVHLHASFVLLVLFLGSGLLRLDPWLLVPLAAVTFLSLLVHELGHALVLRQQGRSCEVALHAIGGHTKPTDGRETTPAQGLPVVAAGPAAGLVLAGLFWAAHGIVQPEGHWAAFTLLFGAYANLLWSLFNLLPVLPLDGGRLLIVGLHSLGVRNVWRTGAQISIFVALLLGGVAISWGHWWPGVVAGMLAVLNVHSIRCMAAQSSPVVLELDQARFAYASGDEDAISIVRDIAMRKSAPKPVRLEATMVLLHWLLPREEFAEARRVLALVPRHARFSAWADSLTQPSNRLTALEVSRRLFRDFPGWDSGLLVMRDVAAADSLDEALTFEREHRGTLGDYGVSLATLLLFRDGRYEEAVRLGTEAWEQFKTASVAYNLACAEAQGGNLDAGLQWLEQALDTGFDQLGHLDEDPDLDPLRTHPGFGALRMRLAPGSMSAA